MNRPAATEHGEYGYAHRHRCHCDPCREVQATYQKRLRYDHARGIRRLIPAEPCRQHLRMLVDCGATVYQIDAASGCNRINLARILAGDFDNVQRHTAERILSTTIEQCLGASQRRVDSIGARRRIDALEYMGHTKADIGAVIGVSDKMVYDYTYSRFLFSDTLAAIHGAYERLRTEEGTSTRVMWMARKRGALPWMCWDDDTIDDPDAEPYEACCVVSRCSRPAVEASLCLTHSRLVAAKSDQFRNGRRYREAIARLDKRQVKDGRRTRREIAELREIGLTEKDISFRLGVDDDYVARLRKESA